jgi:hypothetical protein
MRMDLKAEETTQEEPYRNWNDPTENGGRLPGWDLDEEALKELYRDPNTEKKIDPETGQELMKVRGTWIQAIFPSEMDDEPAPMEETEDLTHSLGKYGRMRLDYLEEHNPDLLNELKARKELKAHLKDMQETVSETIETVIEQMLEKDPPPDKATDPMAWVGHMNMTRMQAESMVTRELLYE